MIDRKPMLMFVVIAVLLGVALARCSGDLSASATETVSTPPPPPIAGDHLRTMARVSAMALAKGTADAQPPSMPVPPDTIMIGSQPFAPYSVLTDIEGHPLPDGSMIVYYNRLGNAVALVLNGKAGDVEFKTHGLSYYCGRISTDPDVPCHPRRPGERQTYYIYQIGVTVK